MGDKATRRERDELAIAKDHIRALTLRNAELERELAVAYQALTKAHICQSPRTAVR